MVIAALLTFWVLLLALGGLIRIADEINRTESALSLVLSLLQIGVEALIHGLG
jgi:hypothetical protein